MATKLEAVTVYGTVTERKTQLRATNASPFFCFEGSSDKEVDAIVTRALDFYGQNADKPTPVVSRQFPVTEFRTTTVRRLKVA